MYEARIERDSVTQYGERLTTFVVTFPRIVLAEFNTHCMLARSSASSRAIPVKTQIDRLYKDVFEPVSWGKNQKGMQAEVDLGPEDCAKARNIWNEAMYSAIKSAEFLGNVGVHKQITNRLLEPFMWHTVIVTATEWSNFFHLRANKMAQPEIQKAAVMMDELYRSSRPKLLGKDEWHLPFEREEEKEPSSPYSLEERIKIAVGRAARVSYLTHDGQRDPSADIKLADSLLTNGHMAPWEHVARPMTLYERSLFGRSRIFADAKSNSAASIFTEPYPWSHGETQFFCGKFNGWIPTRKLIHGEQDILAFQR